MSLMIRNTVRALILHQNKLLLMRIEDCDVRSIRGHKSSSFWLTVGGKVEDGETVEQAALREIYEEAGIAQENVELGPIVWFHEHNLILKEQATHFRESYIVAQTIQQDVSLLNPTEDERNTVKEFRWFSLQELHENKERVLPLFLKGYLPAIIDRKYPEKTLLIG